MFGYTGQTSAQAAIGRRSRRSESARRISFRWIWISFIAQARRPYLNPWLEADSTKGAPRRCDASNELVECIGVRWRPSWRRRRAGAASRGCGVTGLGESFGDAVLAHCDGVRLLPSPAGHDKRRHSQVGHRRDLGWRHVRHRVRAPLVVVAFVIYRLPPPEAGLLEAQGLKVIAGGMMGACILAASLWWRRDSVPLKRSSSIFSSSQPHRC
jgi:hypothetical protein